MDQTERTRGEDGWTELRRCNEEAFDSGLEGEEVRWLPGRGGNAARSRAFTRMMGRRNGDKLEVGLRNRGPEGEEV